LTSKTQVAVVECGTYEEQAVQSAVDLGIQLLGGMQSFIQPGEKIVLKPNILVGDDPEKVVSPHPVVFKAIARQVAALTANLSYGDSPGMGKAFGQAQKAGYVTAAQEVNVPLADFDHGREVHFKDSPFIPQFVLANAVLDNDGLISICKLKTHQLTRITGPVKNQFGCIPGMLKPEFHLKLPDPIDFSKMLVCINLYVRPRLYIVDGIMAMEGNGPRSGRPVKMNVLLLSKDPVALEAVICRLINLNPDFVPTIRYGQEWGLGTARWEEIELLGSPLAPFINEKFDVVRAPVRPASESRATPFARNLLASRPVIDPKLCSQCGTCVRHCPVTPKAIDWVHGDKTRPPAYHYDQCIRCYCCQELCDKHAISVQTPLLGRLMKAI
jgi:uncharacterized protein (DUF362 family)/Pyruvate/2-oxoacid:ferredoxin oxidoreductase delta subunit